MSKVIHSNLFTGGNEKVLIKIYIIASRRLKNKIKVKINIKKLLTIIINI
jgi:hypothetical protein